MKQKSVFECSLSTAQFEDLLSRLLDIIDVKADSLRIYRLPEPYQNYIQEHGVKTALNFNDPLVL